MALVIPVVLMVVLGVIEFGRTYQVVLELTHAASVGSRNASVGTAAADVEAGVRANLPDINQADLTVAVTNPQGPPGTDVSVDLSYRHTLLTGFFTNIFPNGWVDLTSSATHRLE